MCGGTHRSTAVYLRQKAWQRVMCILEKAPPAPPLNLFSPCSRDQISSLLLLTSDWHFLWGWD